MDNYYINDSYLVYIVILYIIYYDISIIIRIISIVATLMLSHTIDYHNISKSGVIMRIS